MILTVRFSLNFWFRFWTGIDFLSCFSKALGRGCYRWCIDQVLKAIADTTCSEICHRNHLCLVKKTIAFVRAEEKPTSATKVTSSGLPEMVQDWELKVNLRKQLKFLETAATKTLRPDMALISEGSKQNSPFPGRTAQGRPMRRSGQSTMEECWRNGCRAKHKPI